MTLPTTMHAVLTTGHGGLDKLEYREDVPVPVPGPGEVLIEVGACGMNNTDINTRTAWYSRSVTQSTGSGGAEGFDEAASDDSTWGGGGIAFPRIQGADVAGHIVAAGEGVPKARVGERVLVDPWLRDPHEPDNRALAGYFGSERDGGYAQFTTAPAENAMTIDAELADAELATFPCSYSTGEYMLTRAALEEGESVLITGASGGVGSALIQLARRRGAHVIAVAGRDKLVSLESLGADALIPRETEDLLEAIRAAAPHAQVDVVADVVGGDGFPDLLEMLARGGRYVTSGAIAGPMVSLDLRVLYLNDLTLFGATVMPREIFPRLVSYIERGQVKPLLAGTFPLSRIREAQQRFLEKKHVGNLVIHPL